MPKYRKIEIDFEVNKKIELERQSFAESCNQVLRRLLCIDVGQTHGGEGWSGKGAYLPDGTKIKMTYNGRLYQGRIHDGHWLVEGKLFNSPSAAASGVALTKSGTRPNIDGWLYWQVKRPEDKDWIPLKFLRQQAA